MKRNTVKKKREVIFLLALLGVTLFSMGVLAVDPVGPDSVSLGSNETGVSASAYTLNISGGYIQKLNLTANVQDPRWKAFVGEVFGTFSLDDASGSTIYDWSLSTVTGNVYATRQSGSVSWSSIVCANTTTLEEENVAMNHTNVDDNITATFSGSTHDAFYVGGVQITANSCPTLNTYVNNATQDVTFEEMSLYDGSNIIYSTILEQDSTGYDGGSYDFQMIVPEKGIPGYSGATAYYLYVELGT